MAKPELMTILFGSYWHPDQFQPVSRGGWSRLTTTTADERAMMQPTIRNVAVFLFLILPLGAALAEATTVGSSAAASGRKSDATTVGSYHRGVAVFTVEKGGLTYEASIAGQKFSYTAR